MFGMSVFQSVLTRLKEEQIEELPASDPPHVNVSGLPSGFVTQTIAVGLSHPDASARLYSGYFDHDAPADPPAMPPHLKRTSPQDIADDLGILDPPQSLADLNELRRKFARDNHPDGVHPDFRAEAAIRMKIANMLIDEAARRLKHSG